MNSIILFITNFNSLDLLKLALEAKGIKQDDFNKHRFNFDNSQLVNLKLPISKREILIIKDFNEKLIDSNSILDNELSGFLNMFDDIKICFHLRNMDKGQKKIFTEKFPNLKYNYLSQSHTTSSLYGTDNLIALLEAESKDKWEKLYDKILLKFHDKELEDKIRAAIEDSENNYAILDSYIAELKKKP
jgi:hypothetical protein